VQSRQSRGHLAGLEEGRIAQSLGLRNNSHVGVIGSSAHSVKPLGRVVLLQTVAEKIFWYNLAGPGGA
jgi:hypothetical protein